MKIRLIGHRNSLGIGVHYSNFADALKYPTTHYVLEPGVYYKRQHKLPADQPRPTQSSPVFVFQEIY